MPNDGFVLYNVGKDLYRVADKDVKAFESENPDASIKYSTDDYDFDIPLSQREEFLKDVPNATFSQYDDKQWQKSKGKDWAPSKYAGLSYDELLKTEEAQRRYAVPFIEDYEKRSQAFMTNSRGYSNPDEAKWLQENLARYEANKADYTDLMRSITKHPEYTTTKKQRNETVDELTSAIDTMERDVDKEARKAFNEQMNSRSFGRRFLDELKSTTGNAAFNQATPGSDYFDWLKGDGAEEYGNDLQNYATARELLRETKQKVNQVTKREVDAAGEDTIRELAKGVAQGHVKYFGDPDTWSEVVGMDSAFAMSALQDKVDSLLKGMGEDVAPEDVEKRLVEGLNDSERALFAAIQTSGELSAQMDKEGISGSVKAGEIMAASEKMGLEFLLFHKLTGPLNKTVARNVEKYFANRLGMKYLGKFGRGMAKLLGTEAGAVAGGITQTALGPSTWSNVGQNIQTAYQQFMSSPAQFIDPEVRAKYNISTPRMGEMIGEYIVDQLIENATEFGFGPTNKALSFLGKGGQKLFTKLGWNQMASLLTPQAAAFLNKMGIQSLGEEVGEEINGAIIDYFRGNKDAIKDFFDKENMCILLASFVPTIGFGTAVSAAQRGAANVRYDKASTAYRDYLINRGVSEKEADRIIASVRGATPEELGRRAARLLNNLDNSSAPGKETEAELITNLLVSARDKAALDGTASLKREDDRESAREELLSHTKGRDFWREREETTYDEEEGAYHEEYVDVLTTNGENNFFIRSEDENGNMETIDENGTIRRFTAAEVEQGLADGTFTGRRQMDMADYLDERNGVKEDAVWEVSAERTSQMAAYDAGNQTGQNHKAMQESAYDTAQNLESARLAAIESGVPEDDLRLGSDVLARQAFDERQAGNTELATALDNYATAKAAYDGLKEGYIASRVQRGRNEAESYIKAFGRDDRIISGMYTDARGEMHEGYILSEDVAIARDGSVTVIGGTGDSMVQVSDGKGGVVLIPASQLSAYSTTFDEYRNEFEAASRQWAENAFAEAESRPSRTAMSNDIAPLVGRTILVNGQDGAVGSMTIVSVNTDAGTVTFKDKSGGGAQNTISIDTLYGMAQRDAEGHIVLDPTATENKPIIEAAQQQAEASASEEAETPQAPQLRVGDEVPVVFEGQPANAMVTGIDNDGSITFSILNEEGEDVRAGRVSGQEFANMMNAASTPAPAAPAQSPTPAPSPAPAPEPAPAAARLSPEQEYENVFSDDNFETEDEAYGFVKGKVKRAKDAADKAQAAVDKIKPEDFDTSQAYRTAKDKAKKDAEPAIADYEHWKAVKDLADAARQAEKERQERLARMEERALMEPHGMREVVANAFSANHSLDREDFKRETGLSDAELRRFFPFWAKKGKGMTVKAFAESIAASDDTGLLPRDGETGAVDINAIRSEIIDLILSSQSPRDIMDYTRNENIRRQEEAERYAEGAPEEVADEGDVVPEEIPGEDNNAPTTEELEAYDNSGNEAPVEAPDQPVEEAPAPVAEEPERRGSLAQRVADILSGKDKTDYRGHFTDKVEYPDDEYYEVVNQWDKFKAGVEAIIQPMQRRVSEIVDSLRNEARQEILDRAASQGKTVGGTTLENATTDVLEQKLKGNEEYQNLVKEINSLNEQISPQAKDRFRQNAIGMIKQHYQAVKEQKQAEAEAQPVAEPAAQPTATIDEQPEAPQEPAVAPEPPAEPSAPVAAAPAIPASPAEISNAAEARLYFESQFGKGKRADNSVRVWELTHKNPAPKANKDGLISQMAMVLAADGFSEEEAAELMTLGTQLAEDYINDGFVRFPQFFKNFVVTFGDGIRPFVKSIYLGASANVSDEIADQMDDRKTVRTFDTTIDINDISDEQDDNNIQPEDGGQPAVVAGSSDGEEGGNSGEGDTGIAPIPGGTTDDSGTGLGSEGGLVGENGGSDNSGAGRGRTNGTPGRRGRNGGRANDGGRSGRGSATSAGGRQDGSESVDEGTGSGRESSIEEKEKAAAEAQAKARQAEKEAIKDITDTALLEGRKDELKAKLSSVTDKYDPERAKMAGQLDAILERLRELYANSASKTETLAQEKIPYQTLSDPEGEHAFGSVVPSGSADAMRDAVLRLEEEEGKNVAEFVKDELGYDSLDEMFSGDNKNEGLSSEQVDSVGLAIHQMKKGKMFIVGDMTGVGKGRQGAALIRWAKRQGKKVLFVTEKPDLFSDMYADLADIGTKDLVPFIVNSDAGANITDKNSEEKTILVKHPGKAEADNLYKSESDELPEIKKDKKNKGKRYDFVMMTYSQAQSSRTAAAQRKLDWIKRYAKDAIVICDESHNASGDSARGAYFRDIVAGAEGVTFMSATFAKRPDNMVLYALRSSMGDAQMTTEDMIKAIQQYGVPMQEILASSLFKTGEMVRRERDFSDVKTHWLEPKEVYSEEEIKQNRDTFDKSMGVVNEIIEFQRSAVGPVIKKLNENFEESNKAASAILMAGGEGVFREYTITPYSSQVSNVANLMFYAIKAKKAADMAIEQIKQGKKPVIAVENTLESYLRDIEGDTKNADFTFVLGRGLVRSLNYRLKVTTKRINKETGKVEDVKEKSSVTDMGSIEKEMGPTGLEMLDALRQTVQAYGEDADIAPLMLSPIDYIKRRITAAGYQCGEITGRSLQLVQAPDGTYHTESFQADKKKAITQFNGGGLDALVLNTAGATGISLHASRRFKDQKPRSMIILQPARDPNTEVQVRGRVDRTGQVSRAEYFYVTSPIPAERKVIMMLRQKLASLDANSVGTENVSSNRVNADDMDNKYGDEVARLFLADHPEINEQLDRPIEQKKGEWERREGLLYDLLIGAQRMTCAEQEMILEELQNAYKDQIEYLNQNGINDLATTTMNLEAVTIDSGLFIKGKDNESMSEFAHDTNIERVEVNVLNKPLRSADINSRMNRLGALNEDGTINGDYGGEILKAAHVFANQAKAERREKHRAAEAELERTLREKYPKSATMTDEEYEGSISMIPELSSLKSKNKADEERLEMDFNKQTRAVAQATTYFKPGMPMFIPLTDDLSSDAPLSFGRFIGFKIPKDGKPKGLKAVFATKDSRASVELPVVSKADVVENIVQTTYGRSVFGGSSLRDIGGPAYDSRITEEMRREARDKWWDAMIPKDTNRQIRYMVTGNILQACGSLGNYKGTITTFTRKDAETGKITVERGMLLAEDFDPENFMVRSAVKKEDVWEGYDQISDNLTNISVQREGDYMVVNFDRQGRENLSKHPIMKDDAFKALTVDGNVDAYSKYRLRAYIPEKNVEQALEHLYKTYGFTKGHLFVMPDSTERVDAIIYTDKPYNDVIDEFEDKYEASEWSIDRKIKSAVQQYKMDVNNEDLKKRIREMVQLRQAYLRRRYAKGESSRLAWQVIIEDENIERAKDNKSNRDEAYARREAVKEELDSRGIHGNPMHFESGRNELDVIIKTFNELNKNKTNAEFAKKVFAIAKRLKLDVVMNEKIHNNTGGQTAGDLVEYNWKYMNSEWITDQMKADTILHELIHTATSYAKRLVEIGSEHLLLQDNPEAYDAVNALDALFAAIKRNPAFVHKQSDAYGDSYTDYGISDWFELLSEAGSNEEFRTDLKKVKVSPRLISGIVAYTDVTSNPEFTGRTMTAWDVVNEQLNNLLDHFGEHAYTEMWRGTGYGQRSYSALTPKGLGERVSDAKKNGILFRDAEFAEAEKAGDTEAARRLLDAAAKDSGYTVRAYHGTARADRVGNVFRPERATSGPMAFFTESRTLAEGYAKGKQDTSIAYDSDYDTYETQFRTKRNTGKDYSVYDVWRYLQLSERMKIAEKAKHIRLNLEGDGEVIYDPNATQANGGWDYQVRDNRGDILRALDTQWLASGNLFGRENDYLKVLEMAGVNEALEKSGFEAPRYMDPEYREEAVYDVYLKIQKPFDVETKVNEKFISDFEKFAQEHEGEYTTESAGADSWDKNSISAEEFADDLRSDLENGTTFAWTSIPDVVTAFLKEQGYDGIKDKGGKFSGEEHAVWIPFYSEQIKSAEPFTYDDEGKLIPISERFNESRNDIRFRESSVARNADGEFEAIRAKLDEVELDATHKMLDSMESEFGIKINRVSRNEMPKGHETDKGYYDTATGEVTICVDNVANMDDAMATVLHESVGHLGLRRLLGSRFNDAMRDIYGHLDRKGKNWVNRYIASHDLKPGDPGIIEGVEEYLSHLAESGDFKNSVWDEIKQIICDVIDAIFGTDGFTLTDNELNYILRASYENLKDPNWLNTLEGQAKDIALKYQLGINETDPSRPTDPDGGIRFRESSGVARDDFEQDMRGWWNNTVTEHQNKYLPVQLAVKRVMEEVGKKELNEAEDFEAMAVLSSSRAQTEQQEFEMFFFSPILDQVRKIRDRIAGKRASKTERTTAYHEVLDYLYRVSGLERNEYKNNEIEQAKIEAVNNLRADAQARKDAIDNDANLSDAEKAARKDAIDAEVSTRVPEIEAEYESRKKDWSGLSSLEEEVDQKALDNLRPLPTDTPKEISRKQAQEADLRRQWWQNAEAKARAAVDDFRSRVGDDAMLTELWDNIRKATDYNLKHALDHGLLTQEEYDRLHGTDTTPRMWNYYLPLRGFAEETAEDVYDYSSFTSSPANGVVVKKMGGRWTEADNPLANILNIAETEIAQGNANMAKQALYRFALNAGENTLLSVRDAWYVKDPTTGKWTVAEVQINPATGKEETLEEFEARMEGLRKSKDQDGKPLARKGRRGLKLDHILRNSGHKGEHIIRLKVAGQEKVIWVNGNPAVAQAVNGVQRAKAWGWLRNASRALSNLFTTYSLDFTARNLIRDTMYSRMGLMAKENRAYRQQYRKNWWNNFGYGAFAFPMVRMMAQWESGRLQQKANPSRKEQMFMDFMRDGGATGYTIINSVDTIKRDLERAMRRSGEKGRKIRIPILGHYAAAVKTLNEGFELLTRFTAYQTSRQVGRSGQRSALDAKEISVNFNRQGAQSGKGGFMGALAAYMGATHYFYNAGVQGFDNFLRLFKAAPVKMTGSMAGLSLLGMMTPIINSAIAGLVSGLGGDDDDDKRDQWYWELPQWVRRNNIVLGWPGFYATIPLPPEFRAFYGLGDIAASFMYDKVTGNNGFTVAGDIINTAFGVLPVNPIENFNSNGNVGVPEGILRTFFPDAGMFIVDLATNRDFTGKPLAKENPYYDTTPASQAVYASDPEYLVKATQWLAQQTAGTPVYVDLNAGKLRDIFKNFGGGFYNTAEDVAKIFMADEKHPLRRDNIPFFSGFTGHLDEDRANNFENSALREYKDISERVVRRISSAIGDKVSPADVYNNPENLPQEGRVQALLEGKDYQLGKMYHDGMNNRKEIIPGGAVYKSGKKKGQPKPETIPGVNKLRQNWKDMQDAYFAMPEGDEKEAFKLQVQDAFNKYHDAEGNLCDRLLEYENENAFLRLHWDKAQRRVYEDMKSLVR